MPNFNLIEEDLMEAAGRRDEFKVPGLRKNIASDVKITTCFYTLNEDKRILNYILDHGFVEGMSVSGNRIWKLMEKRTVVVVPLPEHVTILSMSQS